MGEPKEGGQKGTTGEPRTVAQKPRRPERRSRLSLVLMISILHYLMDPKLWELYGIFLIMGNAGSISSTVGRIGLKVTDDKTPS